MSVNDHPVAFFNAKYVYNDAAIKIPLANNNITDTAPHRRATLLLPSVLLNKTPDKIAATLLHSFSLHHFVSNVSKLE